MGTAEMKIAVLSGKGGAGKTLLSVNLAACAGESVYIDCDVEEPDGHLFFKPAGVTTEEVTAAIPEVDNDRCVGCRKCVDFCRFNALAFVRNRPYVFDEVCHSCLGCILLCPQKALTEKKRVVGGIQSGESGAVRVVTGIMNTGEESGVPIIKKLIARANAESGRPVFIDCPPGSACIVMESIRDADFCILTAEPTAFGAENLAMAYARGRLVKNPHGVGLNKCLGGDNPSTRFCRDNGIPVLGELPYDPELGRITAGGEIAARVSDEYRALFEALLAAVMKEAAP
jgi:MinD superfamily P-loop ATPase